VLGERAQEHDLRARQPDRRAQELGILVQELLRRRRPAIEQPGQPPVDRARRRDAQLLADDRADQRPVVVAGGRARRVALERRRADFVKQPCEDRIGAAKVVERRAQGWPSTPPGTPVFVE
jgi:hypothetical protein